MHIGSDTDKSKSEAMFFPPDLSPAHHDLLVGTTFPVHHGHIHYTDSFGYLGSIITPSLRDDVEVRSTSHRSEMGRYLRRIAALWNEPEIHLISAKCIDFPTYKELDELLYGMNRRQIDEVAAQRKATNMSQDDAVVVGFKSLLLIPTLFQSSNLRKDEGESRRVWAMAEDLGLSDEVAAGNMWAQWLKGMYSYVAKDYNSAKDHYELAAEQGNASAQFGLGLLYDLGNGVRQDYQRQESITS